MVRSLISAVRKAFQNTSIGMVPLAITRGCASGGIVNQIDLSSRAGGIKND